VRGRFAYLALAINLCIPLATAQPARVTGGESHILSAFTSGADPRVLSGGVTLGPALRAELGAETDSRKVYEALVERIGGRRLRVDPVPPAEAVRYASLPGVTPDEPLITLQVGDLVLLLQYAAAQKNVTFVERLSKPAPRSETPKPEPPVVTPEPVVVAPPKPEPPPVTAVPLPAPAPRPAAPVVIEKPKPPAVAVQKPAPARPRGECVIKPVMTEEDLHNCSGPVPSTSVMSAPAAPAAVDKPAAAAPQAPRECVIKAVMSDEDLKACAAVSTPRQAPVREQPVAAEKPAPAAPQAPRECVIKPVMSDEELRACGVRR